MHGARRHAGNEDRDAELQRQQSGRVIHQALAFQQVDDAARQSHLPRDRGGRNRVGGGDDRAEHEPGAPVEGRQDEGSRKRDARHGEADQADGQGGDADEVVRELAPGGDPGPGVEQGRQHHVEDDVGRERDPREARQEADGETGEDQDDGIGQPELARERREGDHGEEQDHEHQLRRLSPAALHVIPMIVQFVAS